MMVSIIIPTFNRINLLPLTLDSIFLDNEIEKEIIVIDDGSTDGTGELICTRYPSVRFIVQNRQGAPAARNFGLKEAQGEYIIFLDSDDLFDVGFIQAKLNCFKNKAHMDAIYGPWDFFKSDGVFDKSKIVPRFSEYPIYSEGQESEIMGNLLGGWFIPISAIMWKKSFLDKIGGFRSDLNINQDVDLIFRAIVENGQICGERVRKTLIREHDSDRVGVVKNDTIKLNQVFELRCFFKNRLEVAGKWNEKYAFAMADYSFDMWALYRKELPVISKKFLDLSKSLHPKMGVKGGFLFQMLGKIIGNHRVVILKQSVKF